MHARFVVKSTSLAWSVDLSTHQVGGTHIELLGEVSLN
jgi:hypothetical protein